MRPCVLSVQYFAIWSVERLLKKRANMTLEDHVLISYQNEIMKKLLL